MRMLVIASAFLLTAPTDAFVVTPPFFGIVAAARPPNNMMVLYNSRIDTAEAVAAALEASKKFGPTSKEARIAWDEVEEMDSSDNTAAFAGSSDTECATDATDPACRDYEEKVSSLKSLLDRQKSQLEAVKSLAAEVRSIALANPSVVGSPDTESMRAALADARSITERFGPNSKESIMAWETVEEIASSDISEATKGKLLDDECLVEALEGCEAIAELQRVLSESKSTR